MSLAEPGSDRVRRLLTILALAASWTLYSWVRIPVPAVNEPHYLAKSKHYWDPAWCAGDLFLESAEAHLVFYRTVGALTRIMSLESAAWCGRLLGFLLLAIGWERLIGFWAPGLWRCTAAAWLFLLMQAAGNFAGEWLVGGVEAKVFSYALAMWSAGELLHQRPFLSGVLLGLSVSFHPVVGAWCVLIVAALLAWRMFVECRTPAPCTTPTKSGRGRPVMAIVGLALASAPGLVPALRIVSGGDPALQLRADLIQVGYRLKHHLDPLQFPLEAYRYYALLLAVWLLLRAVAGRRGWTALERFMLVSLLIAAAGYVAAAGARPLDQLPLVEWRIRLLKLYPFRIADLAAPICVAVAAVDAAVTRFLPAGADVGGVGRGGGTAMKRRWAATGGAVLAAALALGLPGLDRHPSRMSGAVRADWIAACEWLRTQAPADSLIYAANEDWAVKWYAQRPEYVNYKDCPQDAAGIVKWYERLVFMSKWSRDHYEDGLFSTAELAGLHRQTGITHLLVSRYGPMEQEPVFANASFRVYEIGAGPESDSTSAAPGD